MRISELIQKLEKVKEMRGDLLVAIYINESGGSYYSDINYEIVNNTNTNLKNAIGEIVIINEDYFLGIY